jgi:hypothetical protein
MASFGAVRNRRNPFRARLVKVARSIGANFVVLLQRTGSNSLQGGRNLVWLLGTEANLVHDARYWDVGASSTFLSWLMDADGLPTTP